MKSGQKKMNNLFQNLSLNSMLENEIFNCKYHMIIFKIHNNIKCCKSFCKGFARLKLKTQYYAILSNYMFKLFNYLNNCIHCKSPKVNVN